MPMQPFFFMGDGWNTCTYSNIHPVYPKISLSSHGPCTLLDSMDIVKTEHYLLVCIKGHNHSPTCKRGDNWINSIYKYYWRVGIIYPVYSQFYFYLIV